MTAITDTTSQITREPAAPFRLALPSFSIGALAVAIGEAFDMAYAAPYRTTGHPRQVDRSVGPGERDPRW